MRGKERRRRRDELRIKGGKGKEQRKTEQDRRKEGREEKKRGREERKGGAGEEGEPECKVAK